MKVTLKIDSTFALGGRLLFNFLVKDIQNAEEVWEASEGFGLLGIVLKDYERVEDAFEVARQIKDLTGIVSIGLGGGDASQWRRVVDLALHLNPGHINQVFPASGYTIGALEARGFARDNVVNALVSPSGSAGWVIISTGPLSEKAQEQAVVKCDAALRMIKEVGGKSVKVFPIQGDTRLDELAAVARSAREIGLEVIEPTGGITPDNLEAVLRVSLREGPQLVIPHIHSSIIDKVSGRTNADKVREVVRIGKKCVS